MDARFSNEQVIAICPGLAGRLGRVEYFLLIDDVLHPHAGEEILPFPPGIQLTAKVAVWPVMESTA